MSTFALLIIVIIIALVFLILQHAKVVISKRMFYEQSRQIAKEREATAAILGLAQKSISEDMSDETFLSSFAEYAQRTLLAMGGAVILVEKEGMLKGCAVTGIFPPLKEVPRQVEQQLLAHAKKHTDFFRENTISFTAKQLNELCKEKGYAYFKDEFPKIFPPEFKKNAPCTLLAPIYINGEAIAYMIIVSREEFDEHTLSDDDGKYLIRLNEIASLSLEGIRVFREKKEYEEQLQTAREEGMLQVSTGILHNIGNAVTVAKLTILELGEKYPDELPENLILDKVIPEIERRVKDGTIVEFLTRDPLGSGYMEITKELLQHNLTREGEIKKLINSLADKLHHISEIIELQQRFVGELGTENMASLVSVIVSSVKIFEETCNKQGVEIKLELDEKAHEVLIDTSMMTQVFINLIKNAVEAMEDEKPDKKRLLVVSLAEEKINDNLYVVSRVRDNGPGISEENSQRIFDFGFSTKRETKKVTRGYGLHSCKETVEKYGGVISVESKVGEGSTFVIKLPVNVKEKK